jgi:hypothetical protein
MAEDLGQEDVIGVVFWLEEVAAVPVGGGTPDGDAGVTAERGKEIERARNSAT